MRSPWRSSNLEESPPPTVRRLVPMSIRPAVRFVLVAFLALALGPVASTTGAAQLEPAGLVRAVAASPSPELATFAGPDAVFGQVEVHPDMLPRAGGQERTRVIIEPFERAVLEVELERTTDINEGEIWVGRVVGQPWSRAHLRRVGGSLAGTLRTRDGIVQILPDGAGRAVAVRQAAPSFPDFTLPGPDELRETGHPMLRRAAAADLATTVEQATTTTRIDLIVIIEKRVIVETRGLGGWLKNTIRNSVVDLNLALADSGVDAEFNLQTIKRDRHPNQTYEAGDLLFETANPNDRRMKKTQRLRRKFGADIVAVIMRKNTGVCGLGYVGGDRGDGVQPEDAGLAFSVTSWRCLVTGTLPHEIGHNMGGQHSRLDPTSDFIGAYDYSYGHKVSTKFNTVMAYSCEFCTSALLFSTPDVSIEGEPAGVAGGAEPAHNARSFEQDREVLASYRECRRACK